MSPGTVIDMPNDHAERTMLVGLVSGGIPRHVVDEHLDELERLVDTAGGVVVERLVQERRRPDAATVIGSGLVSRLSELCAAADIRTVVFDEDLTGSQVRNLERSLPKNVKVVDRAAVILDIFAQRARTREAQTQVELAQLNYLLPRLTRRWQHLSRQAGGIGTRGVGETQLEIDRRLIQRRISQLKEKLEVIERDRRLRRQRRDQLPNITLAGYTNAGKSSLFTRLTRARVLAEDRLFATLDPRARRVSLGDDVVAVMTDTVGFIRKLPHHLMAPFRSTLEEAADAELVLHVVDAAHPNWQEHLQVGDEVLDDLGVQRDRILVVLNKIDLLEPRAQIAVPLGRIGIAVSAATGSGLEGLRELARHTLLAAPDVAFLRVPLAQPEAIERAVKLPHQLARRFDDRSLEMAMRVDGRRLTEAGLGDFLVSGWGADDSDGGR